jgi:LAO/AO transport system kinase
MKAGVLELPDVFVVNKADQGALAERTARELEAGLGLAERDAGARVVLASARDGRGIDAVLAALDAHGEAVRSSGRLVERRRRGRDRFALAALRARYGSYGLEAIGGEAALADRLAGEPDASGFALAARLGREIEEALRK